MVRNALSVDVEDWFQVGAFETVIDRANWDSLECRVECNTDAVLALFDDAGVKGTFFTLGWVAERYPQLIRRISEAGHEVASHGWDHQRVFAMTPAAFAADIARTRAVLEGLSGHPVTGYRAPSFSIDARTPWAHEALAEAGYAYSLTYTKLNRANLICKVCSIYITNTFILQYQICLHQSHCFHPTILLNKIPQYPRSFASCGL